jgi:hypothetical protein
MQAARRGAAGSGGGGGGGGDDDDSMDVDGDAGGAGAGNGGGFPAASQGTARTPERSRGGGGEAASHDAAGLTPGAAALRTPLSVPRPEFGRPLGGGRGASSMGPVRRGCRRCARSPARAPGAPRGAAASLHATVFDRKNPL